MNKLAGIFKKTDGWYLASSSQTTAGVWIDSPPSLKLEVNATAAAIGEAAIQVIQASKSPVKHPSNWDDLPNPMFELAGVKSWRAFEKGAKYCTLEVVSERLHITPHRSLGPNRGFEPVPQATVDVPFHSSPEQIGTAVATAFLACEQ